jgi:hypothetical protein
VTFASCAILDEIDQLASTSKALSPAVLTQSHQLGIELFYALTAKEQSAITTPGVRVRIDHALDAAFDASCLLANGIGGCVPQQPGAQTRISTQVLVLIRAASGALLDGDTNALIGTALAGVQLLEEDKPDLRRGLQLAAAILQYADTYVVADPTSDKAHESRVKLLQSITQEMTDRTGRSGDPIWSLGGALRVLAGARVGSDVAFYGPIQLPLGFGYDGPQKDGCGFHLDVGLFDLGQYVSFNNSASVRTPEVAEALAPSLTLGAAWGKSFPLTFGVTVSYSPHFQFKDQGARGSFNAGLSLGMYVPLIDLN